MLNVNSDNVVYRINEDDGAKHAKYANSFFLVVHVLLYPVLTVVSPAVSNLFFCVVYFCSDILPAHCNFVSTHSALVMH